MAYYRASSKVSYIGLDSDTKPTDVNEGATFYEANTGKNWIYHDLKWVEDLSMIYALTQALRERT